MRVFTLQLALLGLVLALPAYAEEQCWETPVHRCQSDVEAKEAHDTCAMHKSDAHFWPEPCGEVDQHYLDSGAKAKFDAIERLELQNELDAVKGTLKK